MPLGMVIKAARFSVVLTLIQKVITEEIMILCFQKQRELKNFRAQKKTLPLRHHTALKH